MMPFVTVMIPFSVEFSIMGYLYGNNLTVSAIISARFFYCINFVVLQEFHMCEFAGIPGQ